MKRLLNLLWMTLLLVSCNEVDEFKASAPISMSITSVKLGSDLTWDELEHLATYTKDYGYPAEELRQRSFMLVEGEVTPYDQSSYCYLEWRDADDASTEGYYYHGAVACPVENGRVYFLLERSNIPFEVRTMEFRMTQSTYMDDMTGFVDNCLNNGGYVYYSSQSQTYPFNNNQPYFEHTWMVLTEDYLQSGFRAEGSVINSELAQSVGVCYSQTNEVPTITDEVVRMDDWTPGNSYLNVSAYPTEPGTYFVRAFAETSAGVSYSAVWKMTVGAVELPFEYTVGKLIDISELPYNEVETLGVTQSDLEFMRREGGWLVKVGIPAGQQAEMLASDNRNVLPSVEYPDWSNNLAPFKQLEEQGGDERFFFLGASYLDAYNVKGDTLYYELAMSFGGSWSDYVYSDVYDYKRSGLPILGLFDAVRYGSSGAGEQGYSFSCSVFNFPDESEEMKAGICYSTDNQLPNLDDTGSVILTADSKVVSGGQLNVLHSLAAGTYYVRAFAQSEAGVGYSPVLRIVVE